MTLTAVPTSSPSTTSPTRRWWLALSIPISVVGMVSAAIGAFVDGAYVGMTASWAGQTFAQDLVDLVMAFPLLLVLAWLARRGSIAALLLWLGLLVSIVYAYMIYAFDVPFGPLYLCNVALLGMSGWALAGAATSLDGAALRACFGTRTPVQSTGWALIVLSVLFYGMWFAEDLPALLRGSTPETLREVGLLTNPVHVLDMAFLLPACMVAGVALLRGRAIGYWLAPTLLAAIAAITVGIVTIMVVAISGGESGLQRHRRAELEVLSGGGASHTSRSAVSHTPASTRRVRGQGRRSALDESPRRWDRGADYGASGDL